MPRAIRPLVALFSVATILVFSALPARASIVFTTFVSSPPGAPIGFAYAGNEFVGSIQKDGTGALYSTNLTGGNVQLFAPAVSLAGSPASEHFVASSQGLGGFPNRDIYVAAANTVVHINNAGTASNTFVSGLSGNVRGILFDSVGTFGNQMLVTTDVGNVYRVNSSGTPTLLAAIAGQNIEGLDVAPIGAKFGVNNGSLIVGSDSSGNVYAVPPGGGFTFLFTVITGQAEELTFVPLNLGASADPVEGFYGANYSVNVQKAAVSQFLGLEGDLIITTEDSVNGRVTEVHFAGGTFVQSAVGNFPNQPEDGVFVTTAIIQGPSPAAVPEPATFTLFGVGLLGAVVARIRRRYRRCNS